ncbi:MAG: recombination protein RecR [Candidatus Cloacimonadota bacterium]|nr:MAG: recombination protein RecR [Candidatus Cloacimonadota bacterium]HHE65205.1 recombination protein RecR [Bacteroidota bacterium]
MMFNGFLEDLVNNLIKLPGIGSKTAQRLAIYLISKEKADAINLAESIKDAVQSYKNCSICNMLSEKDPCRFCEDTTRITNVLCVVENTQDAYLIENLHEFKGRYFVLNELLSPLDGIGPDEINFPKLEKIINSDNVDEIILALNPSAEGESTINFLASQFEDKDIKITRLSTGLPFGGDIEYTSSLTLSNAFKRRYSVSE